MLICSITACLNLSAEEMSSGSSKCVQRNASREFSFSFSCVAAKKEHTRSRTQENVLLLSTSCSLISFALIDGGSHLAQAEQSKATSTFVSVLLKQQRQQQQHTKTRHTNTHTHTNHLVAERDPLQKQSKNSEAIRQCWGEKHRLTDCLSVCLTDLRRLENNNNKWNIYIFIYHPIH